MPHKPVALYAVTDHHIHITMTRRPDSDRYAAAVLGCQTVLALVGLGDIATVRPDERLVTDEDIGALHDQWADTNPWA